MTETNQIEAANDIGAQPLCYPRQTDIKAALLARRLQRERLDKAMTMLMQTPANTKRQHDE